MSYLSDKNGRTPRSWRMHLPAVHDGQLILAHQRLAQFLIVERVGSLPPPALAGVVGVDGLLSQHGLQLLERGRLLSAQEDGGIHVADDGVGVVLVDGFELALCLQDQAGGNLPASDGGHQLFQLGDLADVAHSSMRHRTWTGSRPPYTSSAFSQAG